MWTAPWQAPSGLDADELRPGGRMREDPFPVLWRKRAYLVLLGGRHRRTRERPKRRPRRRIVAAVGGGLFVAQIIVALTAIVLMLV